MKDVCFSSQLIAFLIFAIAASPHPHSHCFSISFARLFVLVLSNFLLVPRLIVLNAPKNHPTKTPIPRNQIFAFLPQRIMWQKLWMVEGKNLLLFRYIIGNIWRCTTKDICTRKNDEKCTQVESDSAPSNNQKKRTRTQADIKISVLYDGSSKQKQTNVQLPE